MFRIASKLEYFAVAQLLLLDSIGTTDQQSNGGFMNNLLFLVLILFLVGALPTWPYSAHWGYYPGGGIGLLLLVAVIFTVMNRKSLN